METKPFDELVEAANAGDGDAAYRLAELYRLGDGVEKNDAAAVAWYMKAFFGGSVHARIKLGVLMVEGRGVPADLCALLATLKQRADHGDAAACCLVGMILRIGWGCGTDFGTAMAYLSKGALESRHAGCLNNLAVIYMDGLGCVRDDVAAVEYFRVAAEQGDASAQTNLAEMYLDGRGVETDDVQACAWFRKAAEQGDAEPQFRLGLMYANGVGVNKDDEQAVLWYRKAAEQGDARAQFNLGFMYEKGRGVEKDQAQAVMLYRKAAEQGYPVAQYSLGFMHTFGIGVEKDYALAFSWFRKAAEQGHQFAQYRLGLMYEEGRGVEKDQAQAFEWYRKAADQGDKDAIFKIGQRNELENQQPGLQALRLIRGRQYPKAFKVLERLGPAEESSEGDNMGISDPTEIIHVGVDEEWNQHYVKAIILDREQNMAQALKEARNSALIALERLGPDHTDFAASLNLLSELYYRMKHLDVALALVRRSLVIRFRNLGLWHSEVAECLHNISSYDRTFRPRDVPVSHRECSTLALRIRVKVFGRNHPAVALSLVRLGGVYQARYAFRPAVKCVRKALAIYKETIGEDHCMTHLPKIALEYLLEKEACFNSICGGDSQR
jgi:TPR repeat protein